MTTKAWLEGDSHDLQYLTTLLPSGDVQVRQDGDRFYLASAELDNPTPDEQFHDVARGLACSVVRVTQEAAGLAKWTKERCKRTPNLHDVA